MAFDLSSISSGKTTKKPRITIFGDAGVGKTTFACSAPAPIVIRTEDGLGVLDVAHFPVATSFDDVMSAVGTLYSEEHQFETLVIDSADWLEPLIWADVCRANGVDSIEKMPYGKGYVEALTRWRMLMDGITALRDERNMFTILVAHSQLVRIEDPLNPAYDSHGLKLHKKAAALVEEFSDIVGYADLKTLTVTEDAGFNQKRTRAKTTGERVLHVGPSPAYTAKNRYALPPTLPLDWSAFIEALTVTA
jgi:hypothetical protein